MIINNKRFIILILVFLISFNFILIPKQQSHAVGASLGAIYGVSLGTKVLAFLYACLAAGVTFNALEDAKSMYDKWQMDSDNWEPPINGGNGDNGWNDALQSILLGAVGANSISNLIHSIGEWFRSLGAKEGENNYTDGENYKSDMKSTYQSIDNISVGSYAIYSKFGFIRVNISNIGNGKVLIQSSTFNSKTNGEVKHQEVEVKLATNGVLRNTETNGMWLIYGGSAVVGVGSTVYSPFTALSYSETPKESSSIPYNVSPGAYVTTNNPITTIPQPDIHIVPGIEETVTPSGEKQLIFPGNINDLSDEMVNNITWDDILNQSQGTQAPPYTLTENQTGNIVITEDGQVTAPFPDISVEQPSDTLTGLGQIIALLKSIINWISQIPKLIGDLFKNNKKIDIVPLTNLKINDKFPFCLPWDLMHVINSLNVPGEAPIFEFPIMEEKMVVDMNMFNPVAQIARTFIFILCCVGLIVLFMKVYL